MLTKIIICDIIYFVHGKRERKQTKDINNRIEKQVKQNNLNLVLKIVRST